MGGLISSLTSQGSVLQLRRQPHRQGGGYTGKVVTIQAGGHTDKVAATQAKRQPHRKGCSHTDEVAATQARG